MANALGSLLAQVQDAELARRLKAEFEARSVGTGLVWEHHEPETVDLHSLPLAKGRHVRLLPPRGVNAEELAKTAKGRKQIDPMWGRVGRVADIDEVCPGATRMARVVLDAAGADGASVEVEWDAADLVCVAEHTDAIHMDLTKTGEVRRGGDDDPEHMVINAENLHALQLLSRTHAGSVDAIYIDPPYNTGARDWKYNNDFFDRDGAYRHSKWLSFMEHRLKLSKELLNPEGSVLIATIDEKEYLRLGLLLEQTFPEARIQMVSSVINPAGAARRGFARTDEYVYFVYIGSSSPIAVPLANDWLGRVGKTVKGGLHWGGLRRTGTNAQREDSKNQFYPIFIRNTDDGPVIDSVGESYYGDDRSEVAPPEGCVAIWPIRSDGSEGNWQNSRYTLLELIEKGYVRLGRWRGAQTAVSYLARGERKKVEEGLFPITGHRADGSIIVDESQYVPRFVPGTQWVVPSHNAGTYGTNLIKALLGDKRFTFPKSLYAVEDALRFFVADKPNAVILDFFAGSGTTAHAVMRLNKQDGGKRKSISVTNNELSAEDKSALIAEGLRPGDPEWEALGVAEHVTKPRVTAAITGRTAASGFTEPIKGKYKFVDEFPMADGFEATATFWTLTYLDPAYEP